MTRLIVLCLSLVVISLMLAGISDAKIDPKTCVGMWLLDENSGDVAKDSSGKSNNGQLFGNPNRVAGKFGKCLEFDGDGDYVDVVNSQSLLMSQLQKMTVSVWYKTTQAGYMQLVGRGYTVWELQFHSASRPNLYVNVIEHSGINGSLPRDGNWHHVVALFDDDANTISYYIDGVFSTTLTGITQSIPVSSNGLHIGRRFGAGSVEYFNGLIDDVGVFSVVLTEDDINNIMNNGLAGIAAVSTSGKLTTIWGDIKK